MKNKYFIVILAIPLSMTMSSPAISQCTLPTGAILIDGGFSGVSTVGSGSVYYVPTNQNITIDHTANNLTVSNGGTILVLGNSVLNIQMGGKNFTLNGGTINVCNAGQLNINPGHDFTMQGAGSVISLGLLASMRMCNFGHDITLNAGSIQMNDFSSFEVGNYHNLVSNAVDIVKYTGTGSVGVGTGDPIFHSAGPDFTNYVNTNNVGSPLTNMQHIDFINDALGTDNPGTAHYCGNKNAATYATCRSQWGAMAVTCGGAQGYQIGELHILPLGILQFVGTFSSPVVEMGWEVSDNGQVDHIEIERAVNNAPFETIGDVLPELHDPQKRTYGFTDMQFPTENTAYRLKITEKSNAILYSNIVSIRSQSKTSENTMGCYPNPFSKIFQLRTNFPAVTPATLDFFSNSGVLVFRKQITIPGGYRSTAIENFSSLPAGFYVMKVTTPTGSSCLRMIKQ